MPNRRDALCRIAADGRYSLPKKHVATSSLYRILKSELGCLRGRSFIDQQQDMRFMEELGYDYLMQRLINAASWEVARKSLRK